VPFKIVHFLLNLIFILL